MISPTLTARITALASAISAAAPLSTVSQLQLAALRREGAAILTLLDAALAASGGALDAGDPDGYVGDLPAFLAALQVSSADQAALSDMRSLVGRAVFNLAQNVS